MTSGNHILEFDRSMKGADGRECEKGCLINIPKSIVLSAQLRAMRWTRGLASLSGAYPLIVRGGSVSIGDRLSIRGTQGRVEIGSVEGGELTIGDRVFINWGSTVVAHLAIAIGDDCRIGELVAIFDTSHHALEPEAAVKTSRVSIGRNVWIGRGSIVFPGVEVGDNAVIAAGSIVTSNVEPNTLVGGTPSRPIRTLRSEPGWRRT
jgi:acetyltransferase-like isoleucine patch superfamily enzyme